MKLAPLFLAFSFSLPATAQRVIDVGKDNVNINGTYYAVGGWAVSTAKYVKVVDGTPYFNPDWMKGSLVMKDSTEYINLLLRLDILGNKIEYIGKGREEMVASAEKISEITLLDSGTGKSSRLVHSSSLANDGNVSGWLQVLVAGKATLYKHISKEVDESKPYGSATTEQRIKTITRYYVQLSDSFTRLKKFSDLPELLKDKKKELYSVISKNGLSGKMDADYIAIVFHYNQLSKQ